MLKKLLIEWSLSLSDLCWLYKIVCNFIEIIRKWIKVYIIIIFNQHPRTINNMFCWNELLLKFVMWDLIFLLDRHFVIKKKFTKYIVWDIWLFWNVVHVVMLIKVKLWRNCNYRFHFANYPILNQNKFSIFQIL